MEQFKSFCHNVEFTKEEFSKFRGSASHKAAQEWAHCVNAVAAQIFEQKNFRGDLDPDDVLHLETQQREKMLEYVLLHIYWFLT